MEARIVMAVPSCPHRPAAIGGRPASAWVRILSIVILHTRWRPRQSRIPTLCPLPAREWGHYGSFSPGTDCDTLVLWRGRAVAAGRSQLPVKGDQPDAEGL